MSRKEPEKPLPGPAPVCPICHEKMEVIEFRGYYDTFNYWGCNCDSEALEHHIALSWKGGYA